MIKVTINTPVEPDVTITLPYSVALALRQLLGFQHLTRLRETNLEDLWEKMKDVVSKDVK